MLFSIFNTGYLIIEASRLLWNYLPRKPFQAIPMLREGADKRIDVSIENTDHEIYYLCSAYAARADLRPDRKKSPGIASQKRAPKCFLYGRGKLCATNHACQWIPRRPQHIVVTNRGGSASHRQRRDQDQRNVGHDLI